MMYALDPDLDLTFLIGRAIDSILIGRHEIIIRSEGGNTESNLSIFIACPYTFSGKKLYGPSPAHLAEAGPLLLLLTESIRVAMVLSRHSVSIEFSNDSELVLYGEDKQYECFHILGGPEGDIIV